MLLTYAVTIFLPYARPPRLQFFTVGALPPIAGSVLMDRMEKGVKARAE